PVVVERLRWRRSMCAEEWVYLRAKTSHQAKVTLISAQQAAAYYDPEKSRASYPSRDAYLADIVDFSRREVTELGRLGCSYVQIDAPQYAALLDPELREGYRKRGSDPDKLIDTCIELDNAIISDHPGITFGLHICRGNNQSKYYAEGDYGPIARIFERTNFKRFLLEYDDARSGDFEPLRAMPDDRVVVLGLITTKKPELELETELRGRRWPRRRGRAAGPLRGRRAAARPPVRLRHDALCRRRGRRHGGRADGSREGARRARAGRARVRRTRAAGDRRGPAPRLGR